MSRPQCVGHLVGGGKARGRGLGQSAVQHRAQGRREPRNVQLRRVLELPEDRGDRGVAPEGQRSGEELVEHDPEGVQVAAEVRGLPAELLRAHVARRALHATLGGVRGRDRGNGPPGGRRRLSRSHGEAEVQNLCRGALQEDVARLEVPMNDALLVGLLDRLAHLEQQVHCLLEVGPVLSEVGGQVNPLDELGDEIGVLTLLPAVDQGHDVHLASMYPCSPTLGIKSLRIIPAAFTTVSGGGSGDVSFRSRFLKKIIGPKFRTTLRHAFIPRSLTSASLELRAYIEEVNPDLIHAMRIPYEGMLAAKSVVSVKNRPPLLVSVWGNDFTLHALSTRMMGDLTRQTMTLADALHTDCFRDVPLARDWGFSHEKSSVVLPGGGGIQTGLFYSDTDQVDRSPVVINPRGMRAYVRNDTFFKSIPLVVDKDPGIKFICPTMKGEREAEKWVSDLDIHDSVELLPHQSREGIADLFRQAMITVSPSTHDGTPNTLLEAMACGSFPVAGDIDSLREWINHGENGLLVDPGSPEDLADAIVSAIKDPDIRM